MRVYLKKNITAYSGKDDEEDVVYSSYNEGNICIAKNYTKPRETAQHLVFKTNLENIKAIWNSVSIGYKSELKSYCLALRKNLPDKIKANSYSIFTKILYAYADELGSQVSELEYTTLKTSNINSVSSTIANGFLPSPSVTMTLNTVM